SILQGARERGLHTAIETCGFAPREVMERLLGVTDLIIYDIKHADSGMHERLTGQGNELILANLERIAVLRATGAAGDGGVLIRLPLIPGYNDDNENLEKTAAILQNFGIAAVEIIPYHDFASDKYKLLDAAYQLRELKAYTREQLNSKVALLQDHGLDPRIGV
ncbi:MAG: radical SAM protein, partial [Spirochaetales bacterium]|nr:radical SAM protein [Spirochaetales bacterium]